MFKFFKYLKNIYKRNAKDLEKSEQFLKGAKVNDLYYLISRLSIKLQ